MAIPGEMGRWQTWRSGQNPSGEFWSQPKSERVGRRVLTFLFIILYERAMTTHRAARTTPRHPAF
eukprot:1161294-Prymnesium_polylepis.1